MTEKALTAAVARLLKERSRDGTLTYVKLHGGPMQQAGMPDFLVIDRGRVLFLELKGEGGQVTQLQAFTMRRLENAGARCYVVRSPADALAALDDYSTKR